MHKDAHCSIIYKIENMKITDMANNRKMVK